MPANDTTTAPAPRARSALRERLAAAGFFGPTTWAFVAVLAVYVLRYARLDTTAVHGDAHYSWIFARSLALHRDLLLADDYAACGDPWHVGVDEGGRRPANPFYLGPALLWAPLLALMRALLHLQADAPQRWRDACDGPWVRSTLVLGPLAGALAVWLGGRVARRFVDDRAAAVAMLVIGLGSTLAHFAALVPAYSHTWATLGVAVALWAWVYLRDRPESPARWLLAGVAVGFCALMRAQGVLLLIPVAATAVERIAADLRARCTPWRPVLLGALSLVGFAALFWVQLAAYKKLYGHWWVVPQGRSYLQLGHAHPWLLLFSSRAGLFHWTPLLWLSVGGVVMLVRRRDTRAMTAALGFALAIDLWINAAPVDWHGNASFGARRLTVLAAPAILPTAVMLAWVFTWVTTTRFRTGAALALGWIAPWLLINTGASRGNLDGRVPFDAPVPAPELYSSGLRLALSALHTRVGNPLTFPAPVVFALRYGVSPTAFDRAANGGYFEHSYRPVRLVGCDTALFSDASQDVFLADGLRRTPEGITVPGGQRARVVIPLAWPYVTHVALRGAATGQGEAMTPVTVRVGSFFARRRAATVLLTRDEADHEVSVDPRAFDSGINEVIFEAPRDVRLRSLRFIDRGTRDSSLY